MRGPGGVANFEGRFRGVEPGPRGHLADVRDVEAGAAAVSVRSAAGVDVHRHLQSAHWNWEGEHLELESRGQHGEVLS